jgi:hypothetical protein
VDTKPYFGIHPHVIVRCALRPGVLPVAVRTAKAAPTARFLKLYENVIGGKTSPICGDKFAKKGRIAKSWATGSNA